MSIEATTWALGSTIGKPGDRDAATRKLVLFGYANHAHKDGTNAYAGKATIAVYAECDKRTVQRHTKRLVTEGWMREGDQSQVEHIRADRRPVLYDLAMNDATRAHWRAMAAAGDSSWDSEQRADPWWGRGDRLSPRPGGHGVTDGVTPNAPRGDRAMSPEPSRTLEVTPQPPVPTLTVVCTKPGTKPHPNCRGCRTTPSLQAEDAARAAVARQREQDQVTAREEREHRAANRPPPEQTAERAAQVKAQIRRRTP